MLRDTVELMTSDDYKDRFLAEYKQLDIRIKGLEAMLDKYKNGVLPFTPKCPYELLYIQLISMSNYRGALIERAKIEEIEL